MQSAVFTTMISIVIQYFNFHRINIDICRAPPLPEDIEASVTRNSQQPEPVVNKVPCSAIIIVICLYLPVYEVPPDIQYRYSQVIPQQCSQCQRTIYRKVMNL